jgi:hypothetical protein
MRTAVSIFVPVALAVSACSSADPGTKPATEPAETGPRADAFTCRYTNPFSKSPECKTYEGLGWDEGAAKADCDKIFTGVAGDLGREACTQTGTVGSCRVGSATDKVAFTTYYGGDPGISKSMCEGALKGVWTGGTGSATDDLLEDAIVAMKSDAAVTVEPECVDATCLAPLIEAKKAITFTPKAKAPAIGFVLYPGGLVDPRAYAPVARALAVRGFLVAIVPMPERSALGGVDRANDVIAAHPGITGWYLGGHSLGGVVAARYAASHASKLKGVVLWATYLDGTDDLSKSALPFVSIAASEDGLATPAKVDAAKKWLPTSTRFLMIEGGNHAQFGSYGDQEGDKPAVLARPHQQAIVAGATSHFLRAVEAGLPAIDPAFSKPSEGSAICVTAQRGVAGLSESELPTSAIEIPSFPDVTEFGRSKPEIGPGTKASIPVHLHLVGNGEIPVAPAIFVGEAWCKLASNDRLATQGGFPLKTAGTCAAENAAIFARAKAGLTAEQRASYDASGREIVFGADVVTEGGPQWLGAPLEIVDAGKTRTIRAPAIVTRLDRTDVPEATRGVHYCKLWTLEAATAWLLAR